ncbi:uncharacterized protein LOC120172771 [Hibiscus syriacus]|uniref:uncharacterized protein LOC120172771 n=1 Tax=Hibiscus syriacus TaxID=106335 RepID=UPI001921D939|nr:uncharacterized protein LOC120172771 [Hibiscus syriacus]
MGFNGPQYTWQRGDLSQRLDRCLCNNQWYSVFQASEVFHLQKVGSDHRPILMSTVNPKSHHKIVPFVLWQPGMSIRILRGSWKPRGIRMFHCSLVLQSSKTNVELETWKSLATLADEDLIASQDSGIGMALEKNETVYLLELYEALKNELDKVLEQEESLWHKKSRSQGIMKGDRNTKYFHASTIKRRKRNSIHMLQLEDGRRCDNQATLQSHAVNFFCKLFTSEPRQNSGSDFSGNIGVFGGDTSYQVKDFLEIGVLPDGVNRTMLVIIPEIETPEKISQFRPISLCTSSFVPGRNITDNIILAQEVIHSMSGKTGKKSWMAIKVDLEKEYDRLEWSFIEETFTEAGLPESATKMQMFFSKNCNNTLRGMIARSLGFEEVKNLGKYLGVPLLHGRVTKATYKYLPEKVEKRLAGWVDKSQSLYLAGRITLAKAVLQAIPYYAMQSTWLPKGICDSLEKLIGRFVWGFDGDTRKVSLVD